MCKLQLLRVMCCLREFGIEPIFFLYDFMCAHNAEWKLSEEIKKNLYRVWARREKTAAICYSVYARAASVRLYRVVRIYINKTFINFPVSFIYYAFLCVQEQGKRREQFFVFCSTSHPEHIWDATTVVVARWYLSLVYSCLRIYIEDEHFLPVLHPTRKHIYA